MLMAQQRNRIAAILAAEVLFTLPMAKAQDKPEPVQPAAGIIDVEPRGMETWGDDVSARWNKEVFESLPPSYKAFAGRTFLERLEMKEELIQHMYLRQEQERTLFLTKQPNATFYDFMQNGYNTPQTRELLGRLKCFNDFRNTPLKDMHNTPLKDIRIKAPFLGDVMGISKKSLNWDSSQSRIARELIALGRPLTSINSALPLAKQYELAQFDILTQVALGRRRSSLTEREMSIFMAEMEAAVFINKRAEAAYENLQIRLKKEDQEDAQKGLFPPKGPYKPGEGENEQFACEYVNGRRVFTKDSGAPDSIYDEITRRVAERFKFKGNSKPFWSHIDPKEWERFRATQKTR